MNLFIGVRKSELSVLTRQCLNERRIADIDTLRAEVKAWETKDC